MFGALSLQTSLEVRPIATPPITRVRMVRCFGCGGNGRTSEPGKGHTVTCGYCRGDGQIMDEASRAFVRSQTVRRGEAVVGSIWRNDVQLYRVTAITWAPEGSRDGNGFDFNQLLTLENLHTGRPGKVGRMVWEPCPDRDACGRPAHQLIGGPLPYWRHPVPVTAAMVGTAITGPLTQG